VFSIGHGLVARVGQQQSFFWSRSWEEAKSMCSRFVCEGKIKAANGAYWARVKETVEELNGRNMRAVVIGKREGEMREDTTDGVVLGVVVFEEQQANAQDIASAMSLLQENGRYKIHLRCDSLEELSEGWGVFCCLFFLCVSNCSS
jgi:hypothetical protein